LESNNPIGIFDSGIGGLTVANAILDHLPNEEIVYFGDSCHFPYGEKSADSIKEYSTAITQFLLDKGCKCIIIACNSASSSAYEEVKEVAKGKALVVNVIDPVIYHIQQELATLENLGIIGTRRTIESKAHKNSLEAALPQLKIKDLATPLLAPMVEEGIVNNNISQGVVNHYLQDNNLQDIEAIVLACTHYPLIKDEVQRYYNGTVTLIDIPSVMAAYIKYLLEKNNLMSSTTAKEHNFYVSKWNQTFAQTAKLFFSQEDFKLEEARVFG